MFPSAAAYMLKSINFPWLIWGVFSRFLWSAWFGAFADLGILQICGRSRLAILRMCGGWSLAITLPWFCIIVQRFEVWCLQFSLIALRCTICEFLWSAGQFVYGLEIWSVFWSNSTSSLVTSGPLYLLLVTMKVPISPSTLANPLFSNLNFNSVKVKDTCMKCDFSGDSLEPGNYFPGPFHRYQVGTLSIFPHQHLKLLSNMDQSNAQHPPTLRCHLVSGFQNITLKKVD